MIEMKEIPGFPNYCITKDGQVWSKYTFRWRKLRIKQSGHLGIALLKKKKRYDCLIHRLVLETYVGSCPIGMECRHLNGKAADNRLENLCWGNRSENQQDAVKHGTQPLLQGKGQNNHAAKLTESQVYLIFNAYHDGTHTQQELADYFEVSPACISTIIRKKNWRQLWDD